MAFYQIKRKADGKYFAGWVLYTQQVWVDHPDDADSFTNKRSAADVIVRTLRMPTECEITTSEGT